MMAASASSSQVSEEEDANSSNLRRELLVKGVETEDLTRARQFFQNVRRVARLGVSLGLILAMDKALERGFTAAKIKFPSALFGMFSVVLVLLIVDGVRAEAATRVVEFFEPATTFIQRWLPLFYVPSLVVLPLAVKGIPVSSAPKIGAIIVGGWMASLCVAGYTAIAVRKMVKTNIVPAEPMPKPSPFSTKELWFGIIVFSFSFIFAFLSPTALGTSARTCLLFFLTATALGYIVGSRFPRSAQRLLHPIITCVLFANFAAFAFGFFTGLGYESMLGAYLTKSSSNPGAGDILMGFLGSVIISFAFSIFRQKRLVKRHAVEIFSGVMASTCFSLYSTAALGRVIGLEPTLTICILPRCITLALALGIATLFEVTNPSLTAAVVVLTGLIGANFAQTLLDKLGLNDVIARGMATASRQMQQVPRMHTTHKVTSSCLHVAALMDLGQQHCRKKNQKPFLFVPLLILSQVYLPHYCAPSQR